MKKEWLDTRAIEEIVIEGVDILDRIRKSKAVDDEIVKVVEEIKKTNVKVLRNEEWRKENGLMLKDGKVYVLKDEELRAEVIRLHHDTLVGEHGGQWKTVELVTRNVVQLILVTRIKPTVPLSAIDKEYNRKDVSKGIGSFILGSCMEIAWTP